MVVVLPLFREAEPWGQEAGSLHCTLIQSFVLLPKPLPMQAHSILSLHSALFFVCLRVMQSNWDEQCSYRDYNTLQELLRQLRQLPDWHLWHHGRL